jgi:hypothetical protein
MPINYTVIYDSSTGAHYCPESSSNSVTVQLVQDAIVKHDGTFVEAIDIVYSPDPASGQYPTWEFSLYLENVNYSIYPIDPEYIECAVGFGYGVIKNPAYPPDGRYTVGFAPPANGCDEIITLFYFGNDSGPPTKLTVKVKKKPTFSCP